MVDLHFASDTAKDGREGKPTRVPLGWIVAQIASDSEEDELGAGAAAVGGGGGGNDAARFWGRPPPAFVRRPAR